MNYKTLVVVLDLVLIQDIFAQFLPQANNFLQNTPTKPQLFTVFNPSLTGINVPTNNGINVPANNNEYFQGNMPDDYKLLSRKPVQFGDDIRTRNNFNVLTEVPQQIRFPIDVLAGNNILPQNNNIAGNEPRNNFNILTGVPLLDGFPNDIFGGHNIVPQKNNIAGNGPRNNFNILTGVPPQNGFSNEVLAGNNILPDKNNIAVHSPHTQLRNNINILQGIPQKNGLPRETLYNNNIMPQNNYNAINGQILPLHNGPMHNMNLGMLFQNDLTNEMLAGNNNILPQNNNVAGNKLPIFPVRNFLSSNMEVNNSPVPNNLVTPNNLLLSNVNNAMQNNILQNNLLKCINLPANNIVTNNIPFNSMPVNNNYNVLGTPLPDKNPMVRNIQTINNVANNDCFLNKELISNNVGIVQDPIYANNGQNYNAPKPNSVVNIPKYLADFFLPNELLAFDRSTFNNNPYSNIIEHNNVLLGGQPAIPINNEMQLNILKSNNIEQNNKRRFQSNTVVNEPQFILPVVNNYKNIPTPAAYNDVTLSRILASNLAPNSVVDNRFDENMRQYSNIQNTNNQIEGYNLKNTPPPLPINNNVPYFTHDRMVPLMNNPIVNDVPSYLPTQYENVLANEFIPHALPYNSIPNNNLPSVKLFNQLPEINNELGYNLPKCNNMPNYNVAELAANNIIQGLPNINNLDLFNLGELTGLPIINGLPIIGITETVTVINTAPSLYL